MLAALIGLYRRFRVVKLLVQVLVMVHHLLTPGTERAPCTLENCSATGLAEAAQLGWKALPGILDRINHCGASYTDTYPGGEKYACWLCTSVTSDPDCQKTKPCQSVAMTACWPPAPKTGFCYPYEAGLPHGGPEDTCHKCYGSASMPYKPEDAFTKCADWNCD